MDKVWCVFSVVDYKGGELCSHVNIDVQDLLDNISWNWDCLEDVDLDIEVTDEELWDIWSKWYDHEDRHNLYAYDTGSEARVYSIEDGRLVRDFPTKEEIMKRMKFIIEEWKREN